MHSKEFFTHVELFNIIIAAFEPKAIILKPDFISLESITSRALFERRIKKRQVQSIIFTYVPLRHLHRNDIIIRIDYARKTWWQIDPMDGWLERPRPWRKVTLSLFSPKRMQRITVPVRRAEWGNFGARAPNVFYYGLMDFTRTCFRGKLRTAFYQAVYSHTWTRSICFCFEASGVASILISRRFSDSSTGREMWEGFALFDNYELL